jgi:hypothetical protein
MSVWQMGMRYMVTGPQESQNRNLGMTPRWQHQMRRIAYQPAAESNLAVHPDIAICQSLLLHRTVACSISVEIR